MKKALQAALKKAYKRGHLNIVTLLLTYGVRISEEDLDAVIASVSGRGYLHVLQSPLLADRVATMDIFKRGEAIKKASKGGYVEVVKFLLPEGVQIIDVHLKDVVLEAAAGGYLEVLKVLLAPECGRIISADTRGQAVIQASNRGFAACVEFLLPEGEQVKQHYFHQALNQACCEGHVGVLEILLSPQSGRTISAVERGGAVMQASFNGHMECVEFLLRNGPIYASCRGSCMSLASGRDQEFIRAFLAMATVVNDEEPTWAALGMVTVGSDLTEPEALSYDVDAVLVSLEEIKKNPLSALQQLIQGPLPHKFRLKNSPHTMDLGGVSKQIYYTIFEAMVANGILALTEEGIPFIEEGKSDEIYKTVGLFYTRLMERNRMKNVDPYLTGYVFSEDFFNLLKVALEHPEDDALFIRTLSLCKSSYSPCISYLQDANDENRKAVEDMMAALGDNRDPYTFAKEALNAYKRPILSFLEGARSTGRGSELFQKIRSSQPKVLCTFFQGQKISREGVIAALKVEAGSATYQKHVSWLKEKIQNANEEWLGNLVFAITGRRSLLQSAALHVKPTWREGRVFEFHTCFNSLDLPKTLMSQEDFLQDLDWHIANQGYNIA